MQCQQQVATEQRGWGGRRWLTSEHCDQYQRHVIPTYMGFVVNSWAGHAVRAVRAARTAGTHQNERTDALSLACWIVAVKAVFVA